MLKHANAWKDQFPEFACCGDAVVAQLMAAATLVTVPAGQQVFYPGQACENYLLLLSGSVKAQILSADGREVLLYRVLPGDSCVLTTSCLLGDSAYPAEGYTESDISAFAIPAHVFHRCLQQSAFFREFVFRNFSGRLADVIKRMAALSFASIDQRLAQTLLAEKTNPIRKTHQELALELGSVREVVSRHLKRFESLGWLNLSRGSIEIVDAAALRDMLSAGD
ncbi:Crp/Fnr family transcriptional regulator [Methylomonas sp. EFPC3]|uniref:Crp/Fnr family transcriptional regulator n=1 Tax=Methylomonas sp. EFPC3 TaxID=3021710 RepID=UPI002417B20D|nr:Crp/Fnr family transcriptional regulator [Methylomonas sp. EFPC3]WFP50483.1 Crp/Fnr family transcriptional regulator [Methylomonas sp. EFPC3]